MPLYVVLDSRVEIVNTYTRKTKSGRILILWQSTHGEKEIYQTGIMSPKMKVGSFYQFDDVLVCTPECFYQFMAKKEQGIISKQDEYISAKLLPIPDELWRVVYSYFTGDVTRTRS